MPAAKEFVAAEPAVPAEANWATEEPAAIPTTESWADESAPAVAPQASAVPPVAAGFPTNEWASSQVRKVGWNEIFTNKHLIICIYSFIHLFTLFSHLLTELKPFLIQENK